MQLQPVRLVHVKFCLRNEKVPVGRLALHQGQIFFEYEPSFITRRLPISPFHLPLKQGVQTGKAGLFGGLPGVFNDSLPDGWGKLLLDRAVMAKGIPSQRLTPLDRLAHVGSRGMGALYETSKVILGESQEVIERLLELGGSSAGARPKVLVGYNMDSGQIISAQNPLAKGFQNWIIKFASASDQKDIGQIEYAYSLMAKAAGIEMPKTKLFQGAKGKHYFGVERFDRTRSQRLHAHSASGLLYADHRFPSLDYENLLRCALSLNRDIREVEKVFRLACFNVFAHNRDDHAKNFSFLMNEKGVWSFSPAYDLTFSYGPAGEHSAMVMGEGRAPGTSQLKSLGQKFQIKQASNIIEEVRDTVVNWMSFANTADVNPHSAKVIQAELQKIK